MGKGVAQSDRDSGVSPGLCPRWRQETGKGKEDVVTGGLRKRSRKFCGSCGCVGLAREWGGEDTAGEAMRGWESGLRKEKPTGLGTGPTDWPHTVPAGAEGKDGYGHIILILVTDMR